MRRGHQGSVWRNDYPRNFRPRGGGSMNFRTPRNYNQQEPLRFHNPNHRSFVRAPFCKSTNNETFKPVDQDERNNFRSNVQHLPQKLPGQRLILPYIRNSRNPNNNDNAHYHDNFYENTPNNNFQVNRMGDIDFRHSNRNVNKQPLLPVWNEPHFQNTKHLERSLTNQGYERPYRRESCETNKLPATDFGGHRPHSSDYYGSNPVPDIDNSNSFSHSVDDTVDIIRKKLQNRNDPQYNQSSENEEVNQEATQPVAQASFQDNPREAPRKRIQRQKQNAKVNCDKIKNKIVHQLFKMDKDTIHKLMDNPNSSSKFEYAISSLITESQNSYNRHLRSAAEKSLCQSSTEFIHNDSNTVYEDTFMRQMQCILDPQDTILLEDLKPLVLAELSKVLQLDQFEPPIELAENYHSYDNYDEQYNQCENYPNEDFSPEDKYDVKITNMYDNYGASSSDFNNTRDIHTSHDVKPIFERRPRSTDSSTEYHRAKSYERNSEQCKSLDHSSEKCDSEKPLFESNTLEQQSDEEDPFAELDKQYHVAVDHNFIEGDYNSPQHSSNIEPPSSPIYSRRNPTPPATSKTSVRSRSREGSTYSRNLTDSAKDLCQVKQEYDTGKYSELVCSTTSAIKAENQEFISGSQSTHSENENYVSSSTMKSTNVLTNTRKRVNDQKPSHRKEKRKKSEPHDEEDQTLYGADSKTVSTKPDCGKTTLHSYFKPTEVTTKDTKEIESTHKEYSDKYVKRKETPKKNKVSEQKKKSTVSSGNHSILSQTEKDSKVSQTGTKLDSKTKLKTFDMFEMQPRKVGMSHQALRNTATAPAVKVNANKTESTEPVERSTQTSPPAKLKSKETQTLKNLRIRNKSIQTDPVSFNEKKITPTEPLDAYERMKEIDMEIQNLLQEKFKLYNSLDSKDGIPTSMPALGMTVVSVEENKDDNDSLCEDTIVDDFTNIPVEELEQIALETMKEPGQKSLEIVKEPSPNPTKPLKKSQKQKLMAKERKTSQSPTIKRSKKSKSPSISLIEQIISDERPLEEIIELDDLEEVSLKTRKNTRSKKTSLKKNLTKSLNKVPVHYELKDCSVVILREDLSKYMTKQKVLKNEVPTNPFVDQLAVFTQDQEPCDVVLNDAPNEPETVIEETIVNDIQIDMLDVSEDIIIGDMCEIKMVDDKGSTEQLNESEELILDNSQSSQVGPAANENNQSSMECIMYDYSADENLRRDSVLVSGNADSVLAIESIDNNFLAACLDGNVYYFNGMGQLLNTLRGSNLAVTCLTIVKEKYGTTVYTGSLDSRIRYYDLETGLEKGPECNVLSPIQTMDRAWDTVFVGTRTGFVLQFECKNNMLIPVSTVKFSEQSILALRALKEGPRKVLLVAARSEDVTIKDAQTGLLLRTLNGPKMTVYTLLFEDGRVYCGTSSQQIHVFDYSSGSHVGTHSGGKGAVCLRHYGGLVFAGCYDGCVYVFRQGVSEPVAQLRGPSLMLLSLAVEGSRIIAGYKDRSLYIWKIPLAVLQEMIL